MKAQDIGRITIGVKKRRGTRKKSSWTISNRDPEKQSIFEENGERFRKKEFTNIARNKLSPKQLEKKKKQNRGKREEEEEEEEETI
jgi:hypothetical protein